MKNININWTFVYVALIVGGGAIYTTMGITTGIDEIKKNESDLKAQLSVTLKNVRSDCKAISKEKQFDSNGRLTIVERYSCADGIDYSFSMPSESNN